MYVLFFLFANITDLFIGVFGVDPTPDEGKKREGYAPLLNRWEILYTHNIFRCGSRIWKSI